MRYSTFFVTTYPISAYIEIVYDLTQKDTNDLKPKKMMVLKNYVKFYNHQLSIVLSHISNVMKRKIIMLKYTIMCPFIYFIIHWN